MSDQLDIKEDTMPEIRLPFEHEEFVFGVWVYNHRNGLCVTIISYLLLAIALVAVRISIEIDSHSDTIEIDLTNIEVRKEEPEEELSPDAEKIPVMEEMDWDNVKNLSSNEAMDENTNSDETQRLLDEAAEAERRMASNRANYERGVAEAEAIKEQGLEEMRREAEEKNALEDSNIEGNVTVSYVLRDPIRHSRRLVVPAYTCQGGGRVVIKVQVNPAGEVINAHVQSGGDDCMQQSALKSALSSKFDINAEAPNRQTGVIIYIFVPQ